MLEFVANDADNQKLTTCFSPKTFISKSSVWSDAATYSLALVCNPLPQHIIAVQKPAQYARIQPRASVPALILTLLLPLIPRDPAPKVLFPEVEPRSKTQKGCTQSQ